MWFTPTTLLTSGRRLSIVGAEGSCIPLALFAQLVVQVMYVVSVETRVNKDYRFDYPIEFVKKHILGCFEASKACALLPGKPHLYHVEFLQRNELADKLPSNLPVDFFLKAHFSPCDEVSWYLHTRKDFPAYEELSQADDQFVETNSEGDITPVTNTPGNYVDTMTDTFGCQACANPGVQRRVGEPLAHSAACKRRRSRFDKINKELGSGISGA